MPQPTQIATVIANGQNFSNWLSVEVHRSYDEIVAHCTLSVVEVETGTGTPLPAVTRLAVGTPVTVTLAGRRALTGYISIRQPSYTADAHGVQLVISSLAQNTTVSTVDANPGQYLNMTLQQIAAAVYGKVGVGFSITGSPAGANKVFERVSEMVGETRFAFIERLCRMRNLHQVDDGAGHIIATRQAGSNVATLKEGVNILKARAIISINDSAESLTAVGQDFNTFPGNPSTSATTTVPNVKLQRPVKFPVEQNADNADCAMRCNQERDQVLFDQLEVTITVKDWLMADGTLWIEHINDSVTVISPMLFPENQLDLYIRGCTHRQSSEEGTTTDLLLSQFPGGESLIADDAADTPPPVDIPSGALRVLG